jgi:hypothetical protein
LKQFYGVVKYFVKEPVNFCITFMRRATVRKFLKQPTATVLVISLNGFSNLLADTIDIAVTNLLKLSDGAMPERAARGLSRRITTLNPCYGYLKRTQR